MSSTTPNHWSQYYQATAGRAPRPLLLKALAQCEPRQPDERIAIDIGCGDGTDTLALLDQQWTVLALDSTPDAIALLRARVPAEQESRLQTQVASFAEMELPPADLIFAGLSLPFCHPNDFTGVWQKIRGALRPGGRFAGHFFGDRDSWTASNEMTFHTKAHVEALLTDLTVEYFNEIEEDGRAVSGPKHWHFFEIIACR